jgi:hypothetical protein
MSRFTTDGSALTCAIDEELSQGDASIPAIATEITNRQAHEQAIRAAKARHASGRRRFVDPTTCEKDYSEAEMEFMGAMQRYKQSSGRMFPTWSEVLEVLKSIGYEKVQPEGI